MVVPKKLNAFTQSAQGNFFTQSFIFGTPDHWHLYAGIIQHFWDIFRWRVVHSGRHSHSSRWDWSRLSASRSLNHQQQYCSKQPPPPPPHISSTWSGTTLAPSALWLLAKNILYEVINNQGVENWNLWFSVFKVSGSNRNASSIATELLLLSMRYLFCNQGSFNENFLFFKCGMFRYFTGYFKVLW